MRASGPGRLVLLSIFILGCRSEPPSKDDVVGAYFWVSDPNPYQMCVEIDSDGTYTPLMIDPDLHDLLPPELQKNGTWSLHSEKNGSYIVMGGTRFPIQKTRRVVRIEVNGDLDDTCEKNLK